MADTKHLMKRGSRWYVRVARPPAEWGTKGREFVASLGTGDLRAAQNLRDRYVSPLLAATYAGRFLETLARLAAEADDEARSRLDELRPGLTGVASCGILLSELGQAFCGHLRASGAYAPASIRKYSAAFDAAVRLLGDLDVDSLTKADAVKLRDTMLTLPKAWLRRQSTAVAAKEGERIMTASGVEKHLQALRRAFAWAVEEERVNRQDNPFDGVTPARTATNHKRAPEPHEVAAMMALPTPQALDALSWRMAPIFARYTGCRVGELAQLRAEDVIVRQGVRCLRITGHGQGRRLKTESSERLVPVADKLAPHLDGLLAARPQGLLMDLGDYTADDGTVKRAHTFSKLFNRRAKRVAQDMSFHCLRVYANDAMASADVYIIVRERVMGHKTDRVQYAYTPQNLARMKRAVDTIP